jgi:hypothetical protein
MAQSRLAKPLMILSLAFLMVGHLAAGLACGGQTTTVTTVVLTTGAAKTATTESTTTTVAATGATSSGAAAPAVSDPEVQKLLDQIQETARRASFALYYLGAAYRNAMIAGVMAGGTDSSGAPRVVGIVYRHPDRQDRLVVYVSEYDPVLRPDLKKPFSDWTFIREVETNGCRDVIYRCPAAASALFYVAQRGSTEINLAGFTSEGYMTEEQLIDIAPLLVPVL